MKLNLWNILARLKALQTWLIRPWVLGLGIGAIILVAWRLGAFEVFELKLYDWHLRFRGPIVHRREVVVVDVSEKTFDELENAWPFPRAWFARAIENIEAAKPRAIGLDIAFLERSVFGSEDDQVLAATLKKYDNIVLASFFVQGQLDKVYAGTQSVGIKTQEQIKLPIGPFRDTPSGAANTLRDPDGVVRRAPLFFDFRRTERVETLAGQLYEVATRGGVRVRRPPGREILINYRGPQETFDTIGFQQVYRTGELEPTQLAGKIILIGASSLLLQDLHYTPFAPQAPMSGVEIQVNILDNLLRGDPMRPMGGLIPFLLAVGATAGATFVASRFSRVKALIIVVGVGIVYAIAAYGMLASYRWWLMEVPVQLALFGPYVAIVVRNSVFDAQAKGRLSRFFSPKITQEILKDESVLVPRRRKITVLFSDIRNFTTISEKLPPETVVQALRLYFNTMTPIILRNGGSVDKFVGDAIMAIFNAPTDDPRHADHAVKAGLEMVRAVENLSPHWEQMTDFPLRIGVGINTGEPVVGTMGSDDRREYSCIGDAVNLAARLESATKEVKRDIVISEDTVKELTEDFGVQPVQEIHVKGRAQPVQVYSVETGLVADEPELRTIVDSTLQTISGTRAPSLTRRG